MKLFVVLCVLTLKYVFKYALWVVWQLALIVLAGKHTAFL